jgi:hypothetical protein
MPSCFCCKQLVINKKGASTARRKSKAKSQKSKVLWNKLFKDFQWLLYLRRNVLVIFVN